MEGTAPVLQLQGLNIEGLGYEDQDSFGRERERERGLEVIDPFISQIFVGDVPLFVAQIWICPRHINHTHLKRTQF